MFAGLVGGPAKAAPLAQPRIEFANILGRGDHKDAIAHAQHAGDALVDYLLGQGANGPHLVVDRALSLSKGWSLRGLVHGRLAGVEDQDGHARVVEQLARASAGHRADPFRVVRLFEEQIALGLPPFAPPMRRGDRSTPHPARVVPLRSA